MSAHLMAPVDAALAYVEYSLGRGDNDLWRKPSYGQPSEGAKALRFDRNIYGRGGPCELTLPAVCMYVLADEVRRLRAEIQKPKALEQTAISFPAPFTDGPVDNSDTRRAL